MNSILTLPQLFLHRHSFIRKSDKWTTCSYYLTDSLLTSLWESEDEFVGVRFGKSTKYCLLDIDKDSPYHPSTSNRLSELLTCLENVGFTRYIAIQSSYSGGLHIYFTFRENLPTFKLACLLANTLRGAGFPLKKGHLEIFPNPKTYVVTDDWKQFSQYNGHRLPLQKGSFLLDENYSPYSDDLREFIVAWQWCAENQDLDLIKQHLSTTNKHYKSAPTKISTVLTKWKNDIQKVIEKGWTDFHQTNGILYKLAQKVIVFTDWDFDRKLCWMVDTARKMPGYQQFCRHQHDIRKRCTDWLIWMQKQGYHWQSGNDRTRDENLTFDEATKQINWNNLQQQQSVLSRLTETLHHLSGCFFDSTNILFRAINDKSITLFKKGFSNRSLYKYRHLWEFMLNQWVTVSTSTSQPDLSSPVQNPQNAQSQSQQPLPTPPPLNDSYDVCNKKVKLENENELEINKINLPEREQNLNQESKSESQNQNLENLQTEKEKEKTNLINSEACPPPEKLLSEKEKQLPFSARFQKTSWPENVPLDDDGWPIIFDTIGSDDRSPTNPPTKSNPDSSLSNPSTKSNSDFTPTNWPCYADGTPVEKYRVFYFDSKISYHFDLLSTNPLWLDGVGYCVLMRNNISSDLLLVPRGSSGFFETIKIPIADSARKIRIIDTTAISKPLP